MADLSLNTIHISQNLEQYEAARSSFFIFAVSPDQLTNLYKPDFDPDSGEAIEGQDSYIPAVAADYLRLNVTKAFVPSFTVQAQEFRRGNDVVKFAGVPSFKEGTITVDDVVGLDTKSILYSWLYKAYNPITRKGGRMSEYKKECTLIEYTQDYKPIRKWTLAGCFITGIEEDAFDRESDGKRKLSVTIIYDRATMELDEIKD